MATTEYSLESSLPASVDAERSILGAIREQAVARQDEPMVAVVAALELRYSEAARLADPSTAAATTGRRRAAATRTCAWHPG